MTDPNRNGPTEAPPGSTAAERPTPPWAWATIGVLTAALIAGGLWIAYQSGLSAGRLRATTSTDLVQREVAEFAGTPVASDASASVDAAGATGDAPSAKPPSAPPKPPSTSAAPSSGGKSTSPLTKKYPESAKPTVIPTEWTGVVGAAGSGPWEGNEFDLKAGCVKLRLVVANGKANVGFVQLVQLKPVDWWGVLWASDSVTSVDVTTEPILIGAGTYKIRHTLSGDWSLTVLQ
jgi:hypothetical protein